MVESSIPALFSPIRVGHMDLKHRVVLAPMSRFRTNNRYTPYMPLVADYYAQRASIPGTLLITEATIVAEKAGACLGTPNIPGVWNGEQANAWSQLTKSVHDKDSFVFQQLWSLGRVAVPDILASLDPPQPYVSASTIRFPGQSIAPRPLTIAEIDEYVDMYRAAAINSVENAHFDGVEIHAANGYLIDTFFQDVSNDRDDIYGGSIENRARFGLRIVDEVVKAIGAERTAIRFSPWSTVQGMREANPIPLFSYIVSQIKERHPNLAYISLVEPRIYGDTTWGEVQDQESNDFIRKIWAPKPIITTGTYTRDKAIATAEKNEGNLIGFARSFISNPDLPYRLENDIPLAPQPDRSVFYRFGDDTVNAYTDYPFHDSSVA